MFFEQTLFRALRNSHVEYVGRGLITGYLRFSCFWCTQRSESRELNILNALWPPNMLQVNTDHQPFLFQNKGWQWGRLRIPGNWIEVWVNVPFCWRDEAGNEESSLRMAMDVRVPASCIVVSFILHRTPLWSALGCEHNFTGNSNSATRNTLNYSTLL